MRKEFIKTICDQLKKNKKLFLLVGDLGYGMIEPLVKKYPNSFLNVGVAEQNMAGVAAGIASEGYQVFIYSIYLQFNLILKILYQRNFLSYL